MDILREIQQLGDIRVVLDKVQPCNLLHLVKSMDLLLTRIPTCTSRIVLVVSRALEISQML